jgi:ribosomal silencing factor RsfS
MNIGLLDAIKLLDNGTTEDLIEMAVKYDVSAGDAFVMAMHRAVKVMKSCVPMKPETCREEDKKVRRRNTGNKGRYVPL